MSVASTYRRSCPGSLLLPITPILNQGLTSLELHLALLGNMRFPSRVKHGDSDAGEGQRGDVGSKQHYHLEIAEYGNVRGNG